ncbi:GTPase domain-containing protein [Gordonia rhizosphera]|uniref:G domain-containing protein n=1 Tax=Gordonia rhizosphera NBRC 16068 TaxID=1108045 RepID=K6X1P8_9ACTN|nr:GTPase domain-containing protein [Gordonia rhizosphera]GAB92724.1 hypothetical protein GORHZ_188_00160 [Gordonia rhizosphera NBRC 16068]
MTQRVDDARTWLESAPGVDLEAFDTRWASLAQAQKPVVTVFGSYDTGKSSLIRRILVDSGTAIPDWLTISARHETFEVSEIDVDGYLLRDTPGLAVEAEDVRGRANTAAATDAIALTDIGVVTLTPQLATAEHGALTKLVDAGWDTGTLWFVISRFDEAGIDADGDPDGYRELAERKARELRESLHLDGTVPVYVVSQDYSQLGGSDRHVDPSVWDDSRPWDGMQQLEDDLKAVADRPLAALRDAAAERFWIAAVRTVVAELEEHRAQIAGFAEGAERSSDRLNRATKELQVLDDAARSALHGVLNESVDRSVIRLDVDRSQIVADLQDSLTTWHQTQARELERLLQEIQAGDDSQRAEPEWRGLENLLATDADEMDSQPAEERADYWVIADIAAAIGPQLVKGLREYVKLANEPLGKRAAATTMVKASGVLQAANIAQAALPVVLEVAGMIDDFRLTSASEGAARKRVEQQARAAARQAESIALDRWAATVEETRRVIDQTFGAHAAVMEKVRADADEIASAIERGRQLSQRS